MARHFVGLDMIEAVRQSEAGMAIPITERLKEATRTLHTEVERAGVMRLLLRGQLERVEYCCMLRNFHAIYGELERGFVRHASHPALVALHCEPLFRSKALREDLNVLHGADWADSIALTEAAKSYVEHLHGLSERTPLMLGAHAYVRYLGDLSGGQMLTRIVTRSFDLPPGEGVNFYAFGGVDDVKCLAQTFRLGLDRLADTESSAQGLVDEACAAFTRHRSLFEELASPYQPATRPGSR